MEKPNIYVVCLGLLEVELQFRVLRELIFVYG